MRGKSNSDAGDKPAETRISRSSPAKLQAAEQLKRLRNRLGISTREVEEYSHRIAALESNDEYYVSNAWLTQIENRFSIPSIYKLYSLSIIYRVKFTDLLAFYGVDLDKIGGYQLETPLPRTHLANVEVYDTNRAISFPVRFDPGFKPDRTSLLSRMVEIWGEVPIAFIQQLDFRNTAYGYIGLEDYTLYPLLRPGSFVQIDDRQKRVQKFSWRTEFERPIYFVELRDGYACSWVEIQGTQLTLLPHPLSQCGVRQFAYPSEAEIVGRVTAVAMRLVNYSDSPSAESPKLPRQP